MKLDFGKGGNPRLWLRYTVMNFFDLMTVRNSGLVKQKGE